MAGSGGDRDAGLRDGAGDARPSAGADDSLACSGNGGAFDSPRAPTCPASAEIAELPGRG